MKTRWFAGMVLVGLAGSGIAHAAGEGTARGEASPSLEQPLKLALACPSVEPGDPPGDRAGRDHLVVRALSLHAAQSWQARLDRAATGGFGPAASSFPDSRSTVRAFGIGPTLVKLLRGASGAELRLFPPTAGIASPMDAGGLTAMHPPSSRLIPVAGLCVAF